MLSQIKQCSLASKHRQGRSAHSHSSIHQNRVFGFLQICVPAGLKALQWALTWQHPDSTPWVLQKQTEVKRLEIVVDRQLEDLSSEKAGKAKKNKKVKEEKVIFAISGLHCNRISAQQHV